MKKIFITTFVLLLLFPNLTFAESIVNAKCPPLENLVKPNLKDKNELISALSEIIPKIYGADLEHNEWRIEEIQPAVNLTGFEKTYYKIAITYCGKEVANHSWFVRLRFPKLLPSQSVSLGELYIVKEQNNKWIPWFRYH